MSAHGWAIVDGSGAVNVRTVSDTRRAAIVNWLVVAEKAFVTYQMKDDEIERMWHELRGTAKACPVSITLTESQP